MLLYNPIHCTVVIIIIIIIQVKCLDYLNVVKHFITVVLEFELSLSIPVQPLTQLTQKHLEDYKSASSNN